MVKEDAVLYRQIPKCYAKKKYKKGIKIANKILATASSPICSKVMAWKGLFLGLLGRPEGGLKTVQKGLQVDGKSSLCWHVFGKLLTIIGEFERAIECYRSALTFAPQNAGITMDLACAAAQMGDVEGFRNAAGEVLKYMPRCRQSWVTYAVASHLSGDAEAALGILACFQDAVNGNHVTLTPWELNDLIMYQVRLMKETGNLNEALTLLLESQNNVRDVTTLNESLSELYIKTGRFQEAEPIIKSLLKINPNNSSYYSSLFAALCLTTDHSKAKVLETLCAEFPNQHTPQMLYLEYAAGKKFIHSFTKYMKTQMAKGSLNLFQSIKFLMRNEVKKDFVKSFLTKHHSVFSKKLSACPGNKNQENELLASIVCMANVNDFEKDYVQALEWINKAILVNPLVPDIYAMKAKILKHLMNYTEACKALEKAQRLDPQDRWLETKMVKYIMRADLVDLADRTLAEVYKHGEREDVAQMLWYIYEKAAAFKRMGNLLEALEICCVMERTVVNMKNSLFELHSSNMEHFSMNAYYDFIHASENIRKNKFYLKCAKLAAEIAIQLQDKKLEEYKKRCRKKASLNAVRMIRSGKLGSAKLNNVEEDDTDSDVAPPKTDPNYFQDYLLSVRHFLRHLQTHDANKVETQVVSYEVYSRFRRPLLMMQSLLKARKIGKDHHSLLVPMVHLHQSLKRWEAKGKIPTKKLAVLMEMGKKGLWKNKSMEEIVNLFLRRHSKDLRYMLEGAKALYMLYPARREDALRLACYMGDGAKHLDVATCRKVLDEIRGGTFGVSHVEAEVYRKRCADHFKNTTAFDIDEVKKIRQEDLIRTFDNREPSLVLNPDG